MESVIEQQRKLHEERERVEDAIVREMILKKTTVREKINSDHRIRGLLERSLDCADKLVSIYEDKDGQRQEEIAALSGPDEFSEFYSRLKQLKDFHRHNPHEIEEPMQMEFLKMEELRQNPNEEMQNMVEFSDEEGYGKFLDLHELYDMFVNLKQMEKVDYMTYLQSFDRLYDIPKEKKNAEYKKYLEKLLAYLCNYLDRVRPLVDQNALYEDIKKEFNERWNTGNFPGWRKDAGSAMAKHSGAHLDLSAFSSPEELMSLGLDRLKSALMALGLKCGGTLEERAHRLFSTKGVSLDTLAPSLFAKSKTSGQQNVEKNREIALLEAQIYKYAEILGEQKSSTKENVERRMARTAEELAEESESEPEIEEESDDEETVPYNPKNLPLGWDGKPIPYWLYKLHGLNISYTCEICGNATYRGPKAFQRHFSEWRHAHGMRCLGIPNTAHFANVTSIADAMALWEKLRGIKNQDKWLADNEEEYEDSSGNVFNKKTYEDLRRQGLL